MNERKANVLHFSRRVQEPIFKITLQYYLMIAFAKCWLVGQTKIKKLNKEEIVYD